MDCVILVQILLGVITLQSGLTLWLLKQVVDLRREFSQLKAYLRIIIKEKFNIEI